MSDNSFERETDRWNRLALTLSHKRRVWIQKASEAGFTKTQAEFMWDYVTAKDPESPQEYDNLTSGEFNPKLP